MKAVRQYDTAPEMVVRRLVHSLGFRFRLHRKDLPGSPDLVFPRLRKVIFVHGCFWHRHRGCARTTTPVTRRDFWLEKFAGNIRRDTRCVRRLRKLGWSVAVVWECETLHPSALKGRLPRIRIQDRPQYGSGHAGMREETFSLSTCGILSASSARCGSFRWPPRSPILDLAEIGTPNDETAPHPLGRQSSGMNELVNATGGDT